MRVAARRYAYCFECDTDTVQTLRDVRIPNPRGCFRSRAPIVNYVCEDCGREQV